MAWLAIFALSTRGLHAQTTPPGEVVLRAASTRVGGDAWTTTNDAGASGGAAMWRIGSTDARAVVLEECGGCGEARWGWQDNGYGAGVLGPVVYFATSSPQRLRIQTREDGLGVDQIVLSPSRYLLQAPGQLKNDTTILTPAGGR